MIRRARPEDWEGARALGARSTSSTPRSRRTYFRTAARPDGEWRDLLAAHPRRRLRGHRDEPPERGRRTGLAVVRIYDTPPDPAMVPLRRGHVETLVVGAPTVAAAWGTQLMAEVTDWGRLHGAAELVLTVWEGNVEAGRVLRAPRLPGALARLTRAALSGRRGPLARLGPARPEDIEERAASSE
jgi:hypothetical protein